MVSGVSCSFHKKKKKKMQIIWCQISLSSKLWYNSLLSVLTLAQQHWAYFLSHSNTSHQSFKSSLYPSDIIHTEFCKEVFDTVSSHIFTFYKDFIHWLIFLLIKGIFPHWPLVKAVILTLKYLFSGHKLLMIVDLFGCCESVRGQLLRISSLLSLIHTGSALMCAAT